jgi:hypothetical protein
MAQESRLVASPCIIAGHNSYYVKWLEVIPSSYLFMYITVLLFIGLEPLFSRLFSEPSPVKGVRRFHGK